MSLEDRRRPLRLKTKTGMLAAVLISILFLIPVFFKLDLGATWEYALKADLLLLIAAIILIQFINYCRGLRWKLLIGHLKPISPFRLYEAVTIGFWANFILPLRLGEFIRAYFIRLKESLSLITSLSSIAQERLLDMAAVIVILFGLLALYPEEISQDWLGGLRLTALISLSAIIFVVILFIWSDKKGLDIIGRLSFIPPGLRETIENSWIKIRDGLHHLGDWRKTSVNLALAVLHWFLQVFPFIIVFKAMGIDVSFIQAAYIMVATCFAVSIPAAPGGVGPYHAAVTFGLTLFGTPKEAAVAAAFVIHLVNVLPTIVIGTILILIQPISLRNSLKQAQEIKETTEEVK